MRFKTFYEAKIKRLLKPVSPEEIEKYEKERTAKIKELIRTAKEYSTKYPDAPFYIVDGTDEGIIMVDDEYMDGAAGLVNPPDILKKFLNGKEIFLGSYYVD